MGLSGMQAEAQYFMHTFNLNYAIPQFRNERLNSGIRTVVNYGMGVPANYFFCGIGTSFITTSSDVDNRLRFTKQKTNGTIVANNGYDLSNSTNPGQYFNSAGNSIAEIKNPLGSGGFIGVGTVSDNTITGATTPGGSDWLYTVIKSGSTLANTFRIDLQQGADIAWCIRASVFMPNTWLVCGESDHVIIGTAINYKNAFVARVDANGNVLWCTTVNFDNTTANGLTAYSVAKQLCEDPATGNIYAVGTWTDVGSNDIDGLIFELNPGGGFINEQTFNFAMDDEFQATRWSATGNVLIGGYMYVPGMGYNMFIGMFNPVTLLPLPGMQNILIENAVGITTSKAYDVLERKNTTGALEYYLVGPGYSGVAPIQTMYKANNVLVGTNFYAYNKMFYDVGFGVDMIDNTFAKPGIAYFSSWINGFTGSNDSHSMHLYFNGAACTNLCAPQPPKTMPIVLANTKEALFQFNGIKKVKLVSVVVPYQDKSICSQPNIGCGSNAREFSTDQYTKIYPNPAFDRVHVELNVREVANCLIRIFDVEGKIVQQQNTTVSAGYNEFELNVAALRSGYYVVLIQHGNEETRLPFVKE